MEKRETYAERHSFSALTLATIINIKELPEKQLKDACNKLAGIQTNAELAYYIKPVYQQYGCPGKKYFRAWDASILPVIRGMMTEYFFSHSFRDTSDIKYIIGTYREVARSCCRKYVQKRFGISHRYCTIIDWIVKAELDLFDSPLEDLCAEITDPKHAGDKPPKNPEKVIQKIRDKIEENYKPKIKLISRHGYNMKTGKLNISEKQMKDIMHEFYSSEQNTEEIIKKEAQLT